jgi:hypothetical protein
MESEEYKKRKQALSDRYNEKSVWEKVKEGVSEWWDENEARRKGTLTDYYKKKR